MNHKPWIRSLSTALCIALFVHVFSSYALPRTIAKALFPEQSVQATEDDDDPGPLANKIIRFFEQEVIV